LLPGEGQRTAEERSQALRFFRGRAPCPGSHLRERLDHDRDPAALELVLPRPFHPPVDQEDRRNPALRPIDATSETLGKESLGVARCADDILVEAGKEPHGACRRELCEIARVGREHPGLLTLDIDWNGFIAEPRDRSPGARDASAAPPTRQIVFRPWPI